jgi:serine/threonine protein kinase
MLEFNPDKRPTAKMLLAHSLFDDIRVKNLEDNPAT